MVASFSGGRDSGEEDGFYSDEIDRPTRDEIRAAADIIVHLEENIGLNMKRLRVRVTQGHVKVQGSVESREEMQELEAAIRRYPSVRDLEMAVFIRDPNVED